MDKFDKLIKDAVEGYEAPYNPQAWANVSGQLGSKGGPMKWIIGTAAVATVVVGTVYFMQEEEPQPQNNPVVAENTADTGHTDATVTIEQPADNTINADNSAIEDNIVVNDAGSSNAVNANGNKGNNGNGGTTTTTTAAATPPDQGVNGGIITDPGTTTQNTQVTTTTEPAVVRYNAKFNASADVQCAGTEFLFIPEEMEQAVIYAWDFGDGTYSTSKVGRHIYKKAGNYEVHLLLKDSRSNKIVGSTSTQVAVNPMPATQFSWEQSNEIIPTVNFINLTEDAQTWAWNIKGLKTSTQNQFEYTFRKKGTYVVELTAENGFGCQSTLEKTIDIKEDYNLFAPNAFTPNGDGNTDNFVPEALKLMDVQFTMVVYDKSGKPVYQTNNANMPWDGTNMNDGSMAPEGAYVWTVQFKNAYGEMEYYQGQVIIIR